MEKRHRYIITRKNEWRRSKRSARLEFLVHCCVGGRRYRHGSGKGAICFTSEKAPCLVSGSEVDKCSPYRVGGVENKSKYWIRCQYEYTVRTRADEGCRGRR